tara:strand:- start:46 stop:204 length:159 start_codon:yes stop_codon:yes gene_type:complete
MKMTETMCDKFDQEIDEFMADKCRYCMKYVNPDTEECENALCQSKCPEEFWI